MTDFKATGKNEFVDQYPYLTYSEDPESINDGGGSGTLPIASAETLGGVKIGDGLTITDAGVLSTSGGSVTMFEMEMDMQAGTISLKASYNDVVSAIENGLAISYGGDNSGKQQYILAQAFYNDINYVVVDITSMVTFTAETPTDYMIGSR